MFPFPASHAIALTLAKQKPTKGTRHGADVHPSVQSVRKGLFRRVLDALVGTRPRGADREIEAHRSTIGGEIHKWEANSVRQWKA